MLICCVLSGLASYAQTVANVDVSISMPSVALVDILPSGSNSVTLQMTAPTEAGNTVGTGSSNNTNWLIFTSAVTSGGSRSIKGDVVGTLPTGIRLRLDVSAYVGSGLGFTGGNSYVTANKYLTNTPVSFIDNIKGAYTGITYGSNGFQLTYSLEIQDYANIRSGTSNVTVRYTMADN
ncbi:hypothetical protein J2Y45_002488 [Dyadobacter sp. BE34]|uniref:Uncharacterized protein n=2 Tax=Dyadobacter fermentans TaxID=94254 RepID=A0ABU1QVM0_9BACT|nr:MULTISPECIES: hypothetical protein [unclassified Dyadobacter]MDR6805203.1 hypothetical protein [Dyadobacter fermentans]MDR7043037.1 hypothetical protein [Dyadobacter sp. BE242]MDR7197349.1 hypothetical protein [Dyadobacter sp. BE34]MDR7215217.1 hypothetical protein [Dyadobacter sp. BE31]MDR7262752.1 hypothetical protein [Dyadobacter sp. BE32]